MSIKEERKEHAKACCDYGNRIFGLKMGIRMLLNNHNYSPDDISKIKEMADKRYLYDLKQFINHINKPKG